MADAKNPWDVLAPRFDTSRSDVTADAADNLLIAWPVMLRLIAQHASHVNAIRALDYGCGCGGFAQQLRSMGFQVVGVDSSPVMIETARDASPAEIEFHVADAHTVNAFGPFDVITSIMVFQFVENIAATIQDLASALRDGGVLEFASSTPTSSRNDWHQTVPSTASIPPPIGPSVRPDSATESR